MIERCFIISIYKRYVCIYMYAHKCILEQNLMLWFWGVVKSVKFTRGRTSTYCQVASAIAWVAAAIRFIGGSRSLVLKEFFREAAWPPKPSLAVRSRGLPSTQSCTHTPATIRYRTCASMRSSTTILLRDHYFKHACQWKSDLSHIGSNFTIWIWLFFKLVPSLTTVSLQIHLIEVITALYS